MKHVFCLFPTCYIRVSNSGCSVYDTRTGKYVVETNPSLVTYFKKEDTNSFLLLEEDSQLMNFVEKCVSNGMGYVLDCEVEPVYPNNGLVFISSLRKDLNYTGSFTIQDMLDAVSCINVFVGNQTIRLENVCYPQIDYPEYNISTSFNPFPLLNKYIFSSIKNVILCGDLNIDAIKQARMLFHDVGILCRIPIESYIENINELDYLCKEDSLLTFRVIVQHPSLFKEQKHVVDDFNRSIYKIEAIIRDITDIDFYKTFDSNRIMYRPILHNIEEQGQLLDEMLVTEDDVINSKTKYDDIALRNIVNPNFYGKLTFSFDGTIRCGNIIIGSVQSGNFPEILSDWLIHDNIWYSPRNQKKSCSDCLLSELCPPITVYEYQNILEKICAKV